MIISKKQSAAAILINFTQLFWGASYYGMFGLIIIYFNNYLLYSQGDTMMVIGALGALGPILSSLGGLFCDRYFGSKRGLFIGYSIYFVAYILLSYAAYYKITSASLLALALICFARGLSNTNPKTLIAKSYGSDEINKIDTSYTYNYMINNMGSFFARISFPIIVAYYSFFISFLMCGVLIFIDLLLLIIFKKHLANIGTNPDKKNLTLGFVVFTILGGIILTTLIYFSFNFLDITKQIVYLLGFFVFSFFIFEMLKQRGYQQKAMLIALILLIQTFFFYIYFNLFYSGVVLFAINAMEHSFLGFNFNPVASSAFNPFWIIIFSPILAYVFNKLDNKNKNPSIFIKFIIGMCFTTISYFILSLSTHFINDNNKISMNWLFLAHSFQAIAELLIAALGVSAMVKLVPKQSTGFVVGLQLVTLSLTSMIASVLSKKVAISSDLNINSIEIGKMYGDFFLSMSIWGIFAIISMILSIPLVRYIMKTHNINV